LQKEKDEEDGATTDIEERRLIKLDVYSNIFSTLKSNLNKNETLEDMIILHETLNNAHEDKLEEIDARKDALKTKQYYKVEDIRKQKR
jgi:hypothetical protein